VLFSLFIISFGVFDTQIRRVLNIPILGDDGDRAHNVADSQGEETSVEALSLADPDLGVALG
jgi:hypothetical protein